MSSEAVRERHEAVAGFFTERAARWRDIYRRPDLDGRNFQMRAVVALDWLRRVKPDGSARLLEIGSGAGAQASAASAQGWRVHGVDISLGMLRQAAVEMPGPLWAAADADALPFGSSVFDAVLLNGVIGYVEDPVRTLTEIRRVLGHGGHLVISWSTEYPALDRFSQAISSVGDAVYLWVKELITRRAATPVDWRTGFYSRYLRYWNERDFCAILRTAGYEVRELEAINFGQLRFMERRVVPEWAEVAVSALLERCSRVAPFGFLRNYAKTHLALVRPLPVLESAGVTPAATPSVVPGATPALTRARTARTIAGDIRRLPERVLHARRHRRVLSVVRRNSGEGPVLVLCQGNICRSPYAAAVLSSLVAAHGTRVHSAGFIGPGRPVPDHALRLAGDRGIDLAQHRSRLVTEGLIESAQLVVVMDEDQARAVRVRHPAMRAPVLLLGDFDPSPISRRSIHDPWAQPAHVFAHVFARLDRCTQTLAGALTTREA